MITPKVAKWRHLGTFNLKYAIGAAFDGTSVWVTSSGPATVTKLRPSDGKVLGTYSVGHAPLGVAFDEANIWVANNADNSVTKLRASGGKNLGTFVIGGAYGMAFDGTNLSVTAEPGLREVRVMALLSVSSTAAARLPASLLTERTFGLEMA